MAGGCHDGGETQNDNCQKSQTTGEKPMSIKIIAAYDGTANENDAIALGGLFVRAGAELALAYVRHTHEPDHNRETLVHSPAHALPSPGAPLRGDPNVARHVVTDRSTPEGLGAL